MSEVTFEATVAFPSINSNLARRMESIHAEPFPQLEILPLVGYDSFFDAWEVAIEKASCDVLILTHDDVRIINLPDEPFSQFFAVDPALGVMGVAGTKELEFPDSWWFSETRFQEGLLSGAIYHDRQLGGSRPNRSIYGDFGEVVVLDGACLITTKSRLSKILPECKKRKYAQWDFYDQVLSLEFIKAGYRLRTLDLNIAHMSSGMERRESFFSAAKQFEDEYLVDACTGMYRTWSIDERSHKTPWLLKLMRRLRLLRT